jgi:hypothetical protein
MACFFRRDWLKVIAATLYVAFIVGLNHFMKLPGDHGTHIPGFPQIVYEIMGTLGNPKKGWVLLLLFFLLGFPLLKRKLRVQTLLLLSAAILGPLLSIHFGKYFFLPRQIVGGAFAFLAVAAVGAQKCVNRFKLFLIPVAASLIVPWIFFLMGKGPFVDQPMHKYRQIAHQVKQHGYRNVLWLDPGIITSVHFYFDQEFSANAKTDRNEIQQGLAVNRICYNDGSVCVTIPTSDDFVWNKKSAVESGEFLNFLGQGKFDFVVQSGHGMESSVNVPVVNTW